MFYSNKSTYITGRAIAVQRTEKDSIYLHADTLTILEDSTGQTIAMKGNKHIKIFSSTLQAIADSAYYDNINGQLTLAKSPMIWSKNAQLKGDTIIVFMKDSVINKALIIGKASAIMELDSGLFYNQLSGRKMIAWFEKN